MNIQRQVMVLALVAWPASAFAYVDPGSGMLAWQGLVALIGAVVVFIRNPLAALKALFKRLKRK